MKAERVVRTTTIAVAIPAAQKVALTAALAHLNRLGKDHEIAYP